jgi:deazaflavin-dependent oxidoreductase (nitroreductase family)
VAKRYKVSGGIRVFNRMMGAFIRGGLTGRTNRVLTTVGRRSGLPRSVPVNLVVNDRGEYIVSPYGPTAWVHNVRADHDASLSRGRQEERVSLVEVTGEEAGAVLQQSWARTRSPVRTSTPRKAQT